MISKDWIKLLISFIIIVLLYLIYSLIVSNINKQKAPSEKAVVVPFKTSEKPICSYTRTSCQTNDDCLNKCNDVNKNKFVCKNLDELQPSGSNANGGGKICLPPVPTIPCNTKNGGALIWTGYGATDQQGWNCLCTQPSIWNGPSCDIQNPSYCSGGNITGPNMDCVCPPSTIKMWRGNGVNTPFCASSESVKGGINGLVGNQLQVPNWGNVFYNLNMDDYNDWAIRIARQMNISDKNDAISEIKNILLRKKESMANMPIYELTDDVIISICNNNIINQARKGVKWASEMCSSNMAGRELDARGVPMYQSANKYVTYTYYDQSVYSLNK